MTQFTGTQAQLADHLETMARQKHAVSQDNTEKRQTRNNAFQSYWSLSFAAILVRTAILTEEPTP